MAEVANETPAASAPADTTQAQPAPQFHPQQHYQHYQYHQQYPGMMPITSNLNYLPRIQPTVAMYNRANGPMYMNPNYTFMAPPVEANSEDKAKMIRIHAQNPPQIPTRFIPPTTQFPIQMPTTASYANPLSYAAPVYHQPFHNYHQTMYMPVQSNLTALAEKNLQEEEPANATEEPVNASEEPANASQEQAENPDQTQAFINSAPIHHNIAQATIAHSFAGAPITTRATLLPHSYSYQPVSYAYPGTGYQTIPYSYAAPVVSQTDQTDAVPIN